MEHFVSTSETNIGQHKVPIPVPMLQWNLSKADTIGTNKIVHYIEGVLGEGIIIHSVGYMWDSVSVHD